MGKQALHCDAYLTVTQINTPSTMYTNDEWAFALVVNQTELYAFCVIDNGDLPTDEERLEIQSCHNWYIKDNVTDIWSVDPHLDVDKCDENGNDLVPNVTYDDILCFYDPDIEQQIEFGNGTYSPYQGLFGVYILDNSVSFDNRPIFRQERLISNNDGDWYIIWYDQGDSWVISDYIPSTEFSGFQSICDAEKKPNECIQKWSFYGGFVDIINASKAVMFASNTSSKNESWCMLEPMDTITNYTQNITLCFDDGIEIYYDNILTGKYILADGLYNNRRYWYKDGYYLFYDQVKRYWIISDTLGDSSRFTAPQFNIYCLKWDEFEPFNCDTWYFYSSSLNQSYTQTMTTNCTLPTSSPTQIPTESPTKTPTNQSSKSKNGGDRKSDGLLIGIIVSGCILLCCLVILVIFCVKRRNSRNFGDTDKRGGLASQQDLNAADAMMELGTLHKGTDDGFGNGEKIDTGGNIEDSDIVDNGIDGGDMTTMGGPDENENENVLPDEAPVNWERFESTDKLMPDTGGDGNGDGDRDTQNVTMNFNPFDEDDVMRRQTVGTIGKDGNPFLESDNDGDDLGVPNTMEQRQNWVAFDE